MKVLITGAHFTPAVAVIEEFKKYPDTKIIYVGRKHTLEGDKTQSVESQVLPNLGVKFIPITTGRLQRSFTIYTLISLLKIPIGFLQAFFIILSERPDVILSFGGYVAVPLIFISWLFSIPIIIHEQTLVTGLANKISSVFADKIALSFNNQRPDQKIIITGDPIRKEILNPTNKLEDEYRSFFNFARKQKKPILLVTGGNQGSHVLNTTIEKSLPKLIKLFSIVHITGDSKFQDFERLQALQNESYLVRKWIGDQWGLVLKEIDLAISRAGINTLVEFSLLGIPALVIPIPYLYQDEQNKNAKYFSKFGLVKVLSQSEISQESLINNLKEILSNLDIYRQNIKNFRKEIPQDAAKHLVLETMLLTNKF